jgi:hypothetical protein
VILIVQRVGDEPERAQQPCRQVAARGHGDAVHQRDVFTQIQALGRGIVNDRRREHEWMDLADEDVETGIGQGDAPGVRPEGGWLIERHLLGAGWVDQA